MSNSMNKIAQQAGQVKPVDKSGAPSTSSFGSSAASIGSAAFGFVADTISGVGDFALDGIETASSFFGDLKGSFFGGNDTKAKVTSPKDYVKSQLDNMGSTGTNANLKPQEVTRLTTTSRQKTAENYLEHNKFAVRLKSYSNGEQVVFKSMPVSFSEGRMVVYRPMEITHLPGNYQVYSHTNPRTWQMSIKLFSRNAIEAEENLATITTLKSWTLPYFGASKTSGVGQGANNQPYSAELLGAPPDVLKFTAFSDASKPTGLANIRNIPVVVTSLEIPYPEDVDYIKTQTSQVPFPVIMNISIQLTEVHSPMEYQAFNIVDFKNGNLSKW